MASQSRPFRVPERNRDGGNQLALIRVNPQDATSEASTTQPRRKRASKPKVRTGCTTCKIRRVKCDETKPSCKRCTSTGRRCDGYEFSDDHPPPAEASTLSSSSVALTVAPKAQAPQPQPQLQLPTSLSLAFSGTAKERRIFHRFQLRTIPAFAGSSELDFWESLVLKVGQQEPVVRNAIIALATLHEDYQNRNGKYSQDMITDPSYQHALSLYGKALRQLNERLYEGNKTSAKLALISSILFTCFEVLRRNNMAAIIHYSAGMRELSRQIKTTRQDQSLSSSSSSAAAAASIALPSSVTEFRTIPQDELDVLLRVFACYDIQACTFAKPRAEALAVTIPPNPPTPSTMTLPQVKLHLDNLLISVYQFIKSDLAMYRYWDISTIPADWLQRRDSAILTFETWLAAIEEFYQQHNTNPNPTSPPSNNTGTTTTSTTITPLPPHETKPLLGLLMQVQTALLLLQTCIASPRESSFDAFLPTFTSMLTRMESLADDGLQLQAPTGAPLALASESTTPFTMSLGILHPLFFVATKCRDWGLRRRAIAVLKRGGREGVWEGPVVAVVAEWLLRVEEEGLEWGAVVPEEQRVHDVRKDVDYDARVVAVEGKRAVDLVGWGVWEVVRERLRF